MEIQIKERDAKGFAMARDENKRVGMMTYSVAGDELIIIDHTEVDPTYNGKGIGKQMLYAIVTMARSKNIKIIPLCPYANAMFKKIEEIRDVLKS